MAARNDLKLDLNFLDRIEALESDMLHASTVAARETADFLKRESMRFVGESLHINPHLLASRFQTYMLDKKNKSGRFKNKRVFRFSKVWIGSCKVGVHRLGKPIQQKGGVKVGRTFYDNAFTIKKLKGRRFDQPLVFRRLDKFPSLRRTKLKESVKESMMSNVSLQKFEALKQRANDVFIAAFHDALNARQKKGKKR